MQFLQEKHARIFSYLQLFSYSQFMYYFVNLLHRYTYNSFRYNDYYESRMRLIDQRYKRHSNVLYRKTKPFRKVCTMILIGPRERATNGGMIDAYRGSRLPRRIRHIIHPRDTKDKRVLCYDPPPCAIDTIQISCTEYCWRCALVSHMRARRPIWNLRYLKCLLNVTWQCKRSMY